MKFMKKILCYGDSNTFGFVPETCGRYDKNIRWSGRLGELLKTDFKVIEEGMNNRTGFFKNPIGLKQSGGEYLSIYLQNHRDIDVCILSLGTNDAQIFYNLDNESTKFGLQNLIDSIREANSSTKIVIVPPVKITENILHSGFSLMFNADSINKILDVFYVFEEVAKQQGCYYFDFNKFVSLSETDGLHYSTESHKIIADKLAEFILEITKF